MSRRLPALRTSLRRMFESRRLPSIDGNEDAFRYVHSLGASNFPDGPPRPFDPVTDERLARAIAADVLFVVETMPGRSSAEWYTRSVEDAVRILAAAHPELLDDAAASDLAHVGILSAADARCVLMAAVAVTSQNMPVRANARIALDQYRRFVSHGRFAPVSIGKNGRSIAENLARLNMLLDEADGDVPAVRRLFSTPFKVREFREVAAARGISLGLRERQDETVWGSHVLGPKIGSFYQNLVGNPDALTIDMWLMRTWGRLTGGLMRDEAPAAAVERLRVAIASCPPEAEAVLSARGVVPGDPACRDLAGLSTLAGTLVRAWDGWRKERIEEGADPDELRAAKERWLWPNAAQSLQTLVCKPVDAPANATDRAWIRSVFSRVAQILGDAGRPMSLSAIQATLWYPEKMLVGFLTGRPDPAINVSFDEAFADILAAEAAAEPESDDPGPGARP